MRFPVPCLSEKVCSNPVATFLALRKWPNIKAQLVYGNQILACLCVSMWTLMYCLTRKVPFGVLQTRNFSHIASGSLWSGVE